MFSLISCFTLLISWDKTSSAEAEKVIQPPSLQAREGSMLALPLFCCVTEGKSVHLSEPQFCHLQHGEPHNSCLLRGCQAHSRYSGKPSSCKPRPQQPGEREIDDHTPHSVSARPFPSTAPVSTHGSPKARGFTPTILFFTDEETKTQ